MRPRPRGAPRPRRGPKTRTYSALQTLFDPTDPIGGFPSQRIGSKVRGIARLTHAKCHWRHGAASELHLARHQPRAPAPQILCVNRLVPREPRSAEMGIVGKPRAARMPLAPSGWSPRPLSVPRQLARGLQWGSTTKSGGLRTMAIRQRGPAFVFFFAQRLSERVAW